MVSFAMCVAAIAKVVVVLPEPGTEKLAALIALSAWRRPGLLSVKKEIACPLANQSTAVEF